MSEPIVPQVPEPGFDPHRFTAESRRPANRTVLLILFAFVVLMVLIGASIFLTKGYLAGYMTERAEQRKEEKQMKQTTAESTRLGKVFNNGGGGAALPAALARQITDPSSLPPEVSAAIPLLRGAVSPPGSGAAGAAGQEAAPARPSLMAAAGAADGATVAAAEPARVAPRTVEQQAARAAEGAPPSASAQASAANLGDRSLLLARGSFVPCVLETQLVSNLGGNASCILPQHIYSDDGKVLLLEKGSSIVGVYQSNVRTGDTRIAILWQRIKTATGVVIDVDSPAADQVGVAGAPGIVDNHWPERIGAAFLLSLVEDAVAIEVAKKSRDGANGQTNTVAATANLSEKVLDSTINMAPTLYKNRGDRLMVFVNRDLWFNRVYTLRQARHE